MEVVFYENMSDERYVTKQLTEIIQTNVLFLEDNNVISPFIVVNMIENYNDINYCYIPALGRYYYVGKDGFTILNGNRLKINLQVDVLMSFSAEIKAANAIVVRSNSAGNVLIADALQQIREDEIITNLAFSGCEFLRGINTTNYSFLLTTFGGENSGN